MKTMKSQGFTLIEVLIAAAIGLLLSVAITTVLFQINRIQPAVDKFTYPYMAAEFAHHYMLRDLIGAQVPLTQWLALAELQKAPAKDEKGASADQEQKGLPGSENDKDKEKEEPHIAPIKKIFFASNSKDGMLDTLTFITTNSLQPYWGAKTGKYVPRCVRVTYRLREDKQQSKGKTKQYVLLRQESENLDPAKTPEPEAAQWHRFMVADRVRSCKLEYMAAIRIKPKPEKKAPAAEQEAAPAQPATEKKEAPEETYELEYHKDWPERKLPAKGDKESEKQEPWVPQMVKIELAIYNITATKSVPFAFTVPVYTQYVYEPPVKAPDASQKKLSDVIKKLTHNTFAPSPQSSSIQKVAAHENPQKR